MHSMPRLTEPLIGSTKSLKESTVATSDVMSSDRGGPAMQQAMDRDGGPVTQRMKALRKKRKDPSASRVSSGRPIKRRTALQQPMERRLARARWVGLMFLPCILLLLHRSDEVGVVSDGKATVTSILGVSAVVVPLLAAQEVWGTSHLPMYVACFFAAYVWGSLIEALQDLTAVRLVCMVSFGLCAGQLRYHWDIQGPKRRLTPKQKESATLPPLPQAPVATVAPKVTNDSLQGLLDGTTERSPPNRPRAAGQTPGNDASSLASSDTDAARAMPVVAPGAKPLTPQSGSGKQFSTPSESENATDTTSVLLGAPLTHWSSLSARGAFLAQTVFNKVGIGIIVTVAELIGCAHCVHDGWKLISVSWMGYALVIVLPILTYKVSAWMSHILVLLFGSRVNTADASRLLLFYWVITTVLSLGILIFGIFAFLASFVMYIWSLQLLMTPYCLIIELISLESRQSQAGNPYKEVAEAYAEHISMTMKESHNFLR